MHIADSNSRYHRQELITWWDQEALRDARVLVVGAGAIGNEVVKNLGLVGVGHIEVCDMDDIEHSNLARCVFFTETDEGHNKAVVLARAIEKLNADVVAVGHPSAVQRLGIGHFRSFDIVIGALDNREARAWVNQACRKLGIVWIDAAIEGLRGLVRVFGTEGACYACTLTEADYKQMSHRKSCALLAPEEILSGKTPTNATTAAIVAGIQVQEAIKYLTGNAELVSLVGKVWNYTGDSMDVFVSNYAPDDFCMAHDIYGPIVEVGDARTLADLAELGERHLGRPLDALDFEEDLISLQECPQCGEGGSFAKFRSAFLPGEGRCEVCKVDRVGDIVASISPDSPLRILEISSLGFPMLDIVSARAADERVALLVGGN